MHRSHQHHTDAELVARIASDQRRSEFDLFKDAYTAWYARSVNDRQIERFFVPYLFYQDIPVWVRHYVRSIAAEWESTSGHRGADARHAVVELVISWTWLAGIFFGHPRTECILVA